MDWAPVLALDAEPLLRAANEFPDDAAAKRHASILASILADEINCNAKTRSKVLVLGRDDELVAGWTEE